jgi:hypothetical protein
MRRHIPISITHQLCCFRRLLRMFRDWLRPFPLVPRALMLGLALILALVIVQIDSQARTFFDPARFEDEVAPGGYVHIRYAEAHEFAGRGISWRAVELVASVVGGEAMLLTRDARSQDWSVYLPASQGAMDDFLDVVSAQISTP